MNSPTRFLLGAASSLLLAAGFARAADRIDPLAAGLPSSPPGRAADVASASCNPPCWIDEGMQAMRAG